MQDALSCFPAREERDRKVGVPDFFNGGSFPPLHEGNRRPIGMLGRSGRVVCTFVGRTSKSARQSLLKIGR